MLADINDCYLQANFLANSLYSGKISPEEFNRCINIAQQEYERKMLGFPELYTVEKREAPIEIQVTQVVNDAMRTFLMAKDITKTGLGFTLPSDFVAFVTDGYLFVWQQDGQSLAIPIPIDFLTSAEWGERLQNYVTKPTLDYPAATYENGIIITEPNTITGMKLRYYRYPVTPKWAFTINANDQPVYDPANSVQLEFPSNDWDNIIQKVVSLWATFLREDSLKAMTQNRIVTGQ